MTTQIMLRQADGTITPLGGVNEAAKVFLASLLSGENQTIGGIGVFAAGSEYKAGAGVTDDAYIALGTGAAGDLLEEVVIQNTSGSSATIKIYDGTTEIRALRTVCASGATTPTRIPVGVLSTTGGWQLKIDSATPGDVTSVYYHCTGAFTG